MANAAGVCRAWSAARTCGRLGFGLLIVWLLLVEPPAQAADAEPLRLQAHTLQPRAFGHRTGDVVERAVRIDIPEGFSLDENSLPVVGPQGPVLELRHVGRQREAVAGGQRLTLKLGYQVFAAPVVARSYEIPGFVLRFGGGPRVEELRIDAWPLVVAPLTTEQVSYREGLGEMRPDIAPPLRDAGVEHALLWCCAAVALILGAYLLIVYVGLPGWARHNRPFQRAFRVVRARGDGDDWRQAWRALHAAFDQTAGRTMFADAIDGFIGQAPRFAALKGEIERFYAGSQAAFFGAEAQAKAPEGEWLLGFARACRDAERGTA